MTIGKGRGISRTLLSAVIDMSDNWLALQRLELTWLSTMSPRYGSTRVSALRLKGHAEAKSSGTAAMSTITSWRASTFWVSSAPTGGFCQVSGP